MTRAVTYVEIDIDVCSLVYGESPCTAAIGTTGTKRCFNTFPTCQDTANYDRTTQTLRYTLATEADGRSGITAIPSMVSLRHSPGRIRIAEDLGERASVRVDFEDHRHSDIDLDPYVSTRGYDPLTQGTYWGRFIARNRYLVGRPLRTYQGTAGQALSEMEERHYVIESISGPDLTGRVTITAKDPLRLADGDQAQAPAASTGRLSADLSDSATTFTLEPAGIGALEYDGATYIALNEEIVEVTGRTGDDFTVTRGALNTVAEAHETGDTAQVVLDYSPQAPSAILEDLLTTYAGIPASFIDSTDWSENDTLFVGRNYSGFIAEPTAVRDLVSELLEQVGANMWWDETEQLIRYEPLRVITSAPTVGPDIMLADSFTSRAQPDKRISQVWTYYGKINPLEGDEPKNFRAVAVDIDATAETDNEYGRSAIKKIFSRWVSSASRSAAQEINAKLLSRRRDPPRQFSFDLARYTGADYKIGDALSVEAWPLQNDEGQMQPVIAQVVSVGASWNDYKITSEEFTFTPFAGPGGGASGGGGLNPNRDLAISNDSFDINLRTLYDFGYPDPDDLRQTIDSVDTGTDTITLAGHGYIDTARLVFFGADLPAPLVQGTTYYVISATADTFQVSATEGGSAIDLTDAGTGTQEVRFVVDVPVVIDPGVIVGGTTASGAALDVGTWPQGVSISLTIRTGAYVVGRGGRGGDGVTGFPVNVATSGGLALYTRQAITITNSGTIAGGGGGGGGGGSAVDTDSEGLPILIAQGGGGGGGAGAQAGSGGSLRGNAGALTTGGAGGVGDPTAGNGGAGGGLATAGTSGAAGPDTAGASGGAAGQAIDGDSFVTLSGAGSVLGARVN